MEQGFHEDFRKMCGRFKLDPTLSKKILADVEKHLRSGQAQEADNKGAAARDDDDEIDEKVRAYLKGHGLDDVDIERAIELARKDREAAKDRLPVPATKGGTGGHLSGVGKHDDDMDLSAEYGPGIQNTTRDVYGAPCGDYDPVREAGERAAERLPGSGISRRLAGDAIAQATDEEIIAEYGGAHIKAGMFG
jgi:hypothetical protein